MSLCLMFEPEVLRFESSSHLSSSRSADSFARLIEAGFVAACRIAAECTFCMWLCFERRWRGWGAEAVRLCAWVSFCLTIAR